MEVVFCLLLILLLYGSIIILLTVDGEVRDWEGNTRASSSKRAHGGGERVSLPSATRPEVWE